ncbi:unnamed protein product [Moneuplotes crassus]|uniref:Uncharacterized protein n=1 Tax=Euplotes crassus TaxID=5936 RepID=A0AAD1UL18_EUPCR|nr:unnamed protein product [Moneuplotes crassus]
MRLSFFYHILWGYNISSINWYHRLGDCYYFKFQNFQKIRTAMVLIGLIHIFLMFYLDMKRVLFLIQDWKNVLDFFSLFFVFIYSGFQRTKILLETKLYFILNDPNGEFWNKKVAKEHEDDVQPYTTWKQVVILYEVAITINLFHTYFFWVHWYSEIIEYYKNRQPQDELSILVRVSLAHSINLIPPIMLAFDFMFSKVVFNYRHWFLPALTLIIYKCVTLGGEYVIEYEEMPHNDNEKADNIYFFLMVMSIITGLYLFLAFVTKIKYWIFKPNFPQEGKYMFIDRCVKKAFFDAFDTNFNDENADISCSEDGVEVIRGETEFIKEACKNYAFRDSGLEENIPELAYSISIRPPTPQPGEFFRKSEKNLLTRIKEKLFLKKDIKTHIEMGNISSSSEEKSIKPHRN